MELTQDQLYLLLALAAFVVVMAVVFFARRSKRPAERLRAAPPPAPHEVSANGSLRGVAEAESVLEPAVQEPSARALRDVSAPQDDAPLDIAARETGSAVEVTPPARPHTLEEIQRPEPKALASALTNTRSSFFGRLKNLFGGKPALSSDEMEGLEEILYTSDLGPQTVQRLLDAIGDRMKSDGGSGFEGVRSALKSEMLEIFGAMPDGAAIDAAGSEYIEGLEHLRIWDKKPAVLMIVGVNGAGKTTTIGKLSRRIAQSGRRVLVAAGDTFRAAAGDQLKVWTERAQVEIFSPEGVTDPSAVAYSACEMGRAQGFDVVIIDTAGRLHTQKNLMEELKKMRRVIAKQMPDAPHEVLLVLDANSGQNALIQAREFHQALDVTGVVLTKLDGSAKGGVAVGLAYELKIPIKLIGVGEGIEDLRRFSSQEFVDSIL